MNTPHAVRFLLLKHLWLMRAGVPADRHQDVARSLRVELEGDHYTIHWTDGGRPGLYRIAVDDLSLYRRGDVALETPARADRPNDRVAAAFARHALGVSDDGRAQPATAPGDGAWRSAIGYVLLVGVAAVIDPRGWPLYALLGATALVEIQPVLRTVVWPAFALGALALGFPVTAAAAGIGSAAFTILDPHRRNRLVAAIILLAIAALALARLPAGDAGNALFALAVSPIAVLLIVGRALFGVHLRFLPLVLPVLGVGLLADGHRAGGLVTLAGAALSLASRLAATSVHLRGRRAVRSVRAS